MAVEYYVKTKPQWKTRKQELLSTHATIESARDATIGTSHVIHYSEDAIRLINVEDSA